MKFKVSSKTHLLIVFLLFSFCFFLFYSTLCPNVTWAHFAELGPKLLTQIYTEPLGLTQKHFFYLAVAKLYSLFISHYSLVINSDPAFPINLLSALFSSLTVIVTYFIIFSLSPVLKLPPHLPKPPNLAWLPAAFGSLTLALSYTFWSQAVLTQTTSFNIFLFSLFLFFLLKITESLKKKTKPSKTLLLAFFALTSVLFLNNTLSGFSLDFRTPRQFWENLETIASLILTNFSGASLLLALFGLFFGLQNPFLFLLLSICLGQILLDCLISTSTTPPFFLPFFLVIALFIGLGFKVLLEIILAISLSDLAVSFENRFFLLILRLKKAGKILRYASLCLLGYFVLKVTVGNFRRFYPLVNLRNERTAYSFGQSSFAVLPENSIVFCEDKRFFNTLEYFEKVVRLGKRLEILTFGEDTKKVIKENLPKRPVFFALVKSPIPAGETKGKWEGYALISQGPLYQVLP